MNIVKKMGLTFVWFILTGAATVLFVYLATLSFGWWVGLLAPIALTVIIALYVWAAHDSTGTVGGTIIAVIVTALLIGGAVAITLTGAYKSINLTFWWGLLDFAVLAAGMGLLALYANLYKKIV